MNIKNFNRKFIVLSSKILILLQIFLLLFIIGVKADYQEFTKQLDTMGIDTKQIESGNKISRYDLAKLLNTVECKDCINTPQDMIEKYDNKFWDAFMKIPGKDFADIHYKGGLYKGETYYYCVAYVGDNEYMRGYPLETSPVCGGKFCGEKDTTQAEFYQVIINLSAKYIYNNFITDWKVIKKWMDNIKQGSYADKYLNSIDRKYIDDNASLNKSGYIDNVKYFATYMKYCMFNLKACGFQEIGSIKQAVWPIAEINVLLNQNIIDLPIAQNVDVSKLVNGKTVLDVLYKLYNVVKCDFNNDYDCDLSDNANDNCPNAYNPTQTDTDKDGIGDVCDDDIDNDGIPNPIGIVDDNGRVNIRLRNKLTDTTLWGNDAGDNNMLGIYISAANIVGSAPITVNLNAITNGKVKKVNRDMGDGTRIEGQKISHTFLYPGLYRVKATAYSDGGQATAKTSILIGENIKDQYGIQIQTDKIGGNNENIEILFNSRNVGNIDKIKRSFGDGKDIWKLAGQKFKKILNKKGTYFVVAKGYNGSDLKAIASINIGVGTGNKGVSLMSNVLNPNIGQRIELLTNIWGFYIKDIKNIEINRGDGTKETVRTLLYDHVYDVGGTKTISQTIILKDGNRISNFLTVYVVDLNMANTYAYLMTPNKLITNSYDKISFSTYINGYVLPNYPFIINQHKAGETKMFGDIKLRPQTFEYIYNKKGNYNLISNVYVNQCISLETQAGIGIKGNDICLEARLNGTLSKFKCDMDKDNIPDICDDDIDGDGYKNLIGIVKYENPDCSIGRYSSGENINSGNNVDTELLEKHIGNCSLDNAFSIYNPDQMDLNMNGIGDVFEDQIGGMLGNIDPLFENDNDIDGDGISDNLDLCPEIPENYNLFQDGDGCPEIGISHNCDIRLQFPNLGGLFENLWAIGGGNIGGENNNIGYLEGGDEELINICLEAKMNGTLSQFKCDMDKDNIPDICDDDIDGDGYKNLIGIIKYEHPDCSIGRYSSGENINSGNNVNIEILIKHIGSCYLDNAFFIPNPTQTDLNINGIGDVFEKQIRIIWDGINTLNKKINDWNNDGVPDYIDSCDGGNNIGGSQELPGGEQISIIPAIIQSECFQCPCGFSDIMNDLSKKDAVRASLWDKLGNILYRVSESKSLDLNMN